MSHHITLAARFLLLAVIALAACPALAAELSDAEKETARQVESLLKQAETNLKLAQDSAGAGNAPLTGAKARLVATRMQPAVDAVPAIAERLKKLPADHEQVAALQKRSDAAAAAIAALQARLGAKPATPDASTIKLDFRQEESLKNARFILNEIEGQRAALEKIAGEAKPVEDITKIDHRVMQKAANSIAFAKQRSGFMTDHLSKLPANGAGVATVADGWKAAMASIDASEKIIAPIHKKLTDLVNPANHPQFEADIKRLQELAGQYGYVERFTQEREQAAAMFAQLPAVRDEQARVTKAYDILMLQKTDQGERLTKMDAYLTEKLKLFTDATAAQKESLPKEIRQHIAMMNKLAEQAVREEKPAFFTGGIADEVNHADEKLKLLAALAPDLAKTSAAELDKARADLKVKQKSLHSAIIAANTLPPDRYTGSDRAKLEALAAAAWKQQQKDAVILATRIPSEQWTRSTLWRYENRSWSFIDSSKLQVQLIVKHENGLAVIRPINLWINHANGDKLTAAAMDDVKDELIPQRLLPVGKVK